jgi:hypothetical protein
VAFCNLDRQPTGAESGDDVTAAHPGGHVKFVVLVMLP